MKSILFFLIFSSFAANASPLLTVKDRLRLHMWSYGLDDGPIKKKHVPVKLLPEELVRALRKI